MFKLTHTLFLIIFSLLTAQVVFAQSAFAPLESNHPRHLSPTQQTPSFIVSENGSALPLSFKRHVTESYLPGHMQTSLNYFNQLGVKGCEDSRSADYAIALTIKGDYQGCYDFAQQCLVSQKEKVSVPLIIQGARCAALDYQFAKAHQLFEDGLVSSEFEGSLAAAYVLEYASLALFSNYANEVDRIIGLNHSWSAEQKNVARGTVEYLGAGLPENVTKAQVFEFVDQQVTEATGFYEKLLKGIRISNYLKDYQHQKAYDYLIQDAIQITNHLDWWRQGFNVVYAVSDGIDYTLPKDLYVAYLSAAHSRLTSLPIERNVYNYTQIVNEICHDQMLQEPKKSEFAAQLDLWRAGKMPLSELIEKLTEPSNGFLNKSDVMSTLGSLWSILGDYEKAEQAYWKSHQLCVFNNRSHWGFVLLERRKKYLSFPEFAANEIFVDDTLKNVSFPEVFQKFIPNYNSFPEASKKRIQFAARIWAPFVEGMYQSGHLAYIKLPFERLSEVPNLSEIKDTRIGPPDMPNYLFDNRLWDDVRGAGGETVAADHDEVFNTVHGDYNLLGHEMAHQFQNYVQAKKPGLDACINKLYANPKARDVFPDGYAKSTVAEYFAQGITYYLIPEQAPVRYGTNRSWAKKNDSDFYLFVDSIEKAGGDLEKIKCPIEL